MTLASDLGFDAGSDFFAHTFPFVAVPDEAMGVVAEGGAVPLPCNHLCSFSPPIRRLLVEEIADVNIVYIILALQHLVEFLFQI